MALTKTDFNHLYFPFNKTKYNFKFKKIKHLGKRYDLIHTNMGKLNVV